MKIEFLDVAGNSMDFAAAESGTVLEQLRVDGASYPGTYADRSVRLRVGDSAATESSVTATVRSINTATGGVKETRTLSMAAVGSGVFTSSKVILYDYVTADAKAYHEAAGYILMPASGLKAEYAHVSKLCYVSQVDLDIDTNNDGTIESTNEGEDAYEELWPGKIIRVDRKDQGPEDDEMAMLNIGLPWDDIRATARLEASEGGTNIAV